MLDLNAEESRVRQDSGEEKDTGARLRDFKAAVGGKKRKCAFLFHFVIPLVSDVLVCP